jgi:hypothetical protein
MLLERHPLLNNLKPTRQLIQKDLSKLDVIESDKNHILL